MIKFHGSRGYSLISLMIALTVASIIMMSLTQSYIGSRQANKLTDTNNIMTSMVNATLHKITDDIARSGQYGCYNLRTQYAVAPASFFNYSSTQTGSALINPIYGGIRVFTNAASAIADEPSIANGATLDATTQVLKVQYGEDIALATPVSSGDFMTSVTLTPLNYNLWSGSSLSVLTNSNPPYRLNLNSSTTNSWYTIVSCARLDEVKSIVNSGTTLDVTIYTIPNPTASSGILHDTPSLNLMNAVTRYYYLATVGGVQGLYLDQLMPNGSYSGPLLLLPNVSNLTFDFEVADASNRNTVSASAMQISDWQKISAVNIGFSYQSGESHITTSNEKLNITVDTSISLINTFSL